MATSSAALTASTSKGLARPSLFSSIFRTKGSRIILFLVFLGILIAIVPGLFAPGSPTEQVARDRLLPPMSQGTDGFTHYLGTDHLGRDILSRAIYGARTSVMISVSAVLIAAFIGCTVALIAGFKGGLVDDVLMRLADIQQAFPFMLLAIAVIGVLGPSVGKVILVLGIANWITFARVIRSEVLALRNREYIEAARSIGSTERRVLFRHIVPNVMSSVIVISTFTMASVIVFEAGLSFLSLGVPPSIPSWGSMLADGREYVDTAWWLPAFPGVAISLFVLVINLLGDFLRDALDPHARNR